VERIEFTLTYNKISEGRFQGMKALPSGHLLRTERSTVSYAMLPIIDSGVSEFEWGRICTRIKMDENLAVRFLVASVDDEEYLSDLYSLENVRLNTVKEKLSTIPYLEYQNQDEALLFQLKGRYLFLFVSIMGYGDVDISTIKIFCPGDLFMDIFPEVYKERNSFLHRYLSVFSNLYNELDEDIENRYQLYDPDKADAKRLEMYLRWIGIDASGGYFETEILRNLLKNAMELNRIKGTKRCLQKLCEIVTGKTPNIVERIRIDKYNASFTRQMNDEMYGDSPYDVTVLIDTSLSDNKRHQFEHILQQFVPVRCRLHVVYLAGRGALDGYSFLEENAVLKDESDNQIGFDSMSLDNNMTLK